MNILLLAPHPFFQERGTPIAVNLLLKVLSEHGHTVDVLTYHIGTDVAHRNVAIHRIRNIRSIRTIRPGFSLKKIICDVFMLADAFKMARGGRYDVIHAVEESVFMASMIRRFLGIPYVYDMDSSMPRQIAEKTPLFRIFLPFMRWCERRAIRRAMAVVTMCDSLAKVARDAGATRILVLNDISLLEPAPADARVETRTRLRVSGPCFVYAGNFEKYQGVEMMMKSFAILLKSVENATLVIAGGTEQDVLEYTGKAVALGIDHSTRFTGPWPAKTLSSLFAAADVVVSPRTQGDNTPMKIYSCLDSGKAVLATDMPAHTQVLSADVAMLAMPEPAAFAAAMLRLATDPELRAALGQKGKQLAMKEYSFDAFRRKATGFYKEIAAQTKSATAVA